MSLPRIGAKALMKIPWKRIAQVVIPEFIDKLLDKMRKRKPPASPSPTTPASTSKADSELQGLTTRVQKLEDDLEAALEALRAISEELSKRHTELVSATQIVSSRAIVAIAFGISSLAISVVVLIWGLIK